MAVFVQDHALIQYNTTLLGEKTPVARCLKPRVSILSHFKLSLFWVQIEPNPITGNNPKPQGFMGVRSDNGEISIICSGDV